MKEEELHSDEVMNDYQKYNEITAELEDLNNQLEELMMEWEELSEEMNVKKDQGQTPSPNFFVSSCR